MLTLHATPLPPAFVIATPVTLLLPDGLRHFFHYDYDIIDSRLRHYFSRYDADVFFDARRHYYAFCYMPPLLFAFGIDIFAYCHYIILIHDIAAFLFDAVRLHYIAISRRYF